MGGETSVQIFQWKGREFPNEDSIFLLEYFKLTAKMNDKELMNMIRRDYGYCICRQTIYKSDGSAIQTKYFPERNSEKMNWIYIGILKDTNCRCSYYESAKLNELFVKEMNLLHNENKELKKLVEKNNSEINKLKSTITSLENKINNLDVKIANITQNDNNKNNNK